MFILEVDWAIYKRLTGYPLDSSGRPRIDPATGAPTNRERIGPPDLNPYEKLYNEDTGEFTPVLPKLPSYGIRIPMMKGSRAPQGITSFNPDGLPLFDKFERNAFRQVPVFDENITGRKIEDIWPCVTFRWNGIDFDQRVFVYHDPFGQQDTASDPVQVTNRNGDVVLEGFAKNLVRPHPESWPMTYVITAYSKSRIELGLICNEIIRLFPARGAVNVEMADGTVHPCDMLLQRTETLDEGGDQILMTRGDDEQRGFVRAFIYSVESYVDNTVNAYGTDDIRKVVAVRERILELDSLMGELATKESESDLNQGELKPITA